MLDLMTIPGLVRISDNVYKDVEWDCTFILCKDMKSLYYLYEEIKKNSQSYVAFDFETGGESEDEALDPMECEVLGCSFGLNDMSGYVYLEDDIESKKEVIKKILEDLEIIKIAHNQQFDTRVAYHKLGIRTLPVVFDTMIASYLLDEQRGVHGLKQVATKYLGIDGYKYKKIVDSLSGKKFLLKNVAPEIVGIYGAADSLMTYRLKSVLEKKIKEEGLDRLLSFSFELSFVLAQMEIRGVKIDREYLDNIGREIDNSIQVTVNEIYKLVGKEFNISSSKQLADILYVHLGINPESYSIKKQKTGYSTDEDSLNSLIKAHPVVKYLLEYRKLTKLKSTYIDGILERLKPDGRVHGQFLIHGTRTGRLSSHNPNLQNIPRDGKIKRMFVADKGYKIVKMDYDQIELRVLAYYSQDSEMIKIFNMGGDIHSEVAKTVFDIDCDVKDIKKKYTELRNRAKGINFGIAYGMGANTLAQDINVSVEEADKFIQKWLKRFNAVLEFKKEVFKFLEENEYVVNVFGRRRRFYGYKQLVSLNAQDKEIERMKREAFNFMIQSTAVDIVDMALVRVYIWIKENDLDIYPLWQVHDELGFEVNESNLDKVKEIESILIQKPEIIGARDFNVPLSVSISVADSWGG